MPKIDTTVGNLVEMIRNGELRLPEMQRRYIWPATRVRDLLDSLYRGYPSGTILVWETDQSMPVRDLAVSQGESPFKGHKMLLDGQQRLTSLSAVVRAEPISVRGRKRPIEILFNLEHPDGAPTEVIEVDEDATDSEEDSALPNVNQGLKVRTFVVANQVLLNDRHWVRVSDIFQPEITDAQILKPLVSSLDDPRFDKFSKRLQAVRKIKDYQYVMHVLDKNLSYEEVAEIFVRVNSLGIKLRGSDLALAQITSRWQGSLKLFEQFQEECEDVGFTLDLGLLVRTLVVFATSQSRFKTVGNVPVQKLKAGWEAAKQGIRFSLNFLRTNAGIENETLLSSATLIIVPGFYAAQHSYEISADDEKELRQWLYIANARGHYSGSSETVLDADLRIIADSKPPSELIAFLRNQLGRLETLPEDFVAKNPQSALFPTTYLALKARGAKDWRTGLGLSLTHQGRSHYIEAHHIFSKALLKKAGYETSDINEITNMAFVSGETNRKLSNKPADEYLAEIKERFGAAALEAHCIPADEDLWKVDQYAVFLEYRRAALSKAVNEFIANIRVEQKLVDAQSLINEGESELIEFKSSARWDYKQTKYNKDLEVVIAKTIAGFLNAAGGILIIGVADDGTVLGLESEYNTLTARPNRDGYEQFLVGLVSKKLGKVAATAVKLEFSIADGKEVCIMRCEPSQRPVYSGDDARFYVRLGNTTQELNPREAEDYIARHWNR
jgi:hypothetical protein